MTSITTTCLVLLAAIAAAPLAACTAETSSVDASTDESAVVVTRSFTGKFVSMAAIGGETTGTWLEQASGKRVELDLTTHNLFSRFVDGKSVTVTGSFKTVRGIEIATRQVLVVATVKAASGGGVTAPGTSVLTEDASKIVVQNHGGGFVAPGPAGSKCAMGAGKFTLDLTAKTLDWTVCNTKNGPFVDVSGHRALGASDLSALTKKLAVVKVAKDASLCGADKPFETVTVTSPDGSFDYMDAFYGCMEPVKTHVDGIDEALSALEALAR